MNTPVHTSTAKQPYYVFFLWHAVSMVGTRLPSINGEEDDMAIAHRIIKETHKKMTRKSRSVVNRKHKEQRVEQDALVWVKQETTDPGVCKKLNVWWNGPYQVVEVLRNGGTYIVKDLFSGQQLQWAAEKIKLYHGDEEWLLEPQNTTF